MPIFFEPNFGQADPSVQYFARGPNYALFLTRNEAVLSLAGKARKDVLRFEIAVASSNSKIGPLDSLSGRSNYFIGKDPKSWKTDEQHYAKVRRKA